jgi:hypothetical protein
MESRVALPARLERIRLPALLVGLLGLAACLVGVLSGPPHRFFLSYLFSYLFWIGIPLGCAAVLMLQHLTGGGWGLVIRRLLESGTRMLPLMALLFVPLLFGLDRLYPWTHDPHARGEGEAPFRAFYLTTGFFVLRAALYFAAWIVLGILLNRWSVEEDRAPRPELARRFRLLSAGGLVVYGLTVSFAAVDWVMSLSPEWRSSIIGMLFIAGQGVSGLGFVIALAALLSGEEPIKGAATPERFQDLGNLLLAFVMVWAYCAFSQFLIIWSADIKDEVSYYLYRGEGGWQWMALLLFLLHFLIPFLLLLSRFTKRRREMLGSVALALVVLRLVDLFWMVVPGQAQGRELSPVPPLRVHWLDLAAPLGIGGIWVAVFLWQLKREPLLPPNDFRLAEGARHG